MRRFTLFCCAATLLACAKSEKQETKDSAAMAPAPTMAPAGISLAAVAGKWKIRNSDEGGANAVESELNATADSTGWTWTLPNRSPIPVRVVAVAGDSIVTEAGPFESVLRKGLQVTNRTVYRLQDGKLVGTIEAHFATAHGDSVVHRRTEATRVP